MADKDLYENDPQSGGGAAPEAPPAEPRAVKLRPSSEEESKSLLAELEAKRAVAPARRGRFNFSIGTPRIPDAILTAFLRQLVMQLEAGVTLLKALTTLADRTPDRNFRNVVLDIGLRVEGGSTFWQAFDAHPKHFDRLFVNMVKAAEASGTLPGTLNRIATYREKKAMLRRQVRSAMIYPTVILIVTVGVIVLFLTLVLPGFQEVFGQFDLQLPAFTRAALALSASLRHFWYLYIVVIVGAIFGIRAFIATPGGRMAWDRFKMRAPVAGDLVTKAVVADFTRTFSTLLRSGVSIIETLDLTRDAVGNTAFAVDLKNVRDSIERGEGLEKPLRQSNLMPAIVTDMLVTGEESGSLEGIAAQIADIYESEVEAAVVSLKNLIEPVMIFILGTVIGGLALSFFLPYVSLIEQIMEGGVGGPPGG